MSLDSPLQSFSISFCFLFWHNCQQSLSSSSPSSLPPREEREEDSFKFEGTWADESESDEAGKGPLDLGFLSSSYLPNRLDWESKKFKRNKEYGS